VNHPLTCGSHADRITAWFGPEDRFGCCSLVAAQRTAQWTCPASDGRIWSASKSISQDVDRTTLRSRPCVLVSIRSSRRRRLLTASAGSQIHRYASCTTTFGQPEIGSSVPCQFFDRWPPHSSGPHHGGPVAGLSHSAAISPCSTGGRLIRAVWLRKGACRVPFSTAAPLNRHGVRSHHAVTRIG
jgi:hypothetical protein